MVAALAFMPVIQMAAHSCKKAPQSFGKSSSKNTQVAHDAPDFNPEIRTTPLLKLGVCCMASKAASKPMEAILRRLKRCGDFDIIVFPEPTILGEPPEEWPIVDCFIGFTSSGFPLEKCVAYCKLRKPRCINNLEAQSCLLSRTCMYRKLEEWCIPCPEHVVIDHTAIVPGDLIENENYIVYKGKKISKPFVEKPEDADCHAIWIYYPRSIGGGAKKLFRKVGDKSSEFDPNQNDIRRDGTYIYEPFLTTQGTDIKVYTVGAGYVHAEARKAPTVDGKVHRTGDGKEFRHPVVLTQREKAMAAFIVKAFRQNICGFDILRTDSGSYVCDVNGWSFVKGNQKYYNDCATLIRQHFLEECGFTGVDTARNMILGPDDENIGATGMELSACDYGRGLASQNHERLRAVIVVMRHGDRRPKEKVKFKTKQPEILAYFDNVDAGAAEVTLRSVEEMDTLKDTLERMVVRLREEVRSLESGMPEDEMAAMKQELLGMELALPVLSMEDRFSGLERKVQFKVIERKAADYLGGVSQVQVVAKWGGELTVTGLAQAGELGRTLRHELYPNDPAGLLRLHASFRHDFKIYSAQEGRCQTTAAAFTQGFLDLEGDIIPILASLVQRDKYAQDLLEKRAPKEQRVAIQQQMKELLTTYAELNSPDVVGKSCPTPHKGLREATNLIGSPLQLLHTVRALAFEYIDGIASSKQRYYEAIKLHSGLESPETHIGDFDDIRVVLGRGDASCSDSAVLSDIVEKLKGSYLPLKRKEQRWRTLMESFVVRKERALAVDDNVSYDCTKIPDIWYYLYYDLLRHRQLLDEGCLRVAEMMVSLVHPLHEWVCSSQYGISQDEKLNIGVSVSSRLLGSVLNDLEFMIDGDVAGFDKFGRRLSTSSMSVPSTPSACTIVKPVSQEKDDRVSVDSPNDWREIVGVGHHLGGEPTGVIGSDRAAFETQNHEHSFQPVVPTSDLTSTGRKASGESVAIKDPDVEGTKSVKADNSSKITRLTPEIRAELKKAMQDSSDWHPRLNDQVAKLTDVRNTQIVRSRIYVTSASTMHSLLNVMKYGHEANGEKPLVSNLDDVVDLNYLSHIVFRCYENDPPTSSQESKTLDEDVSSACRERYRVEISLSPGVQMYDEGQRLKWPKGNDVRDENCIVAPLQVISENVDLARLARILDDAVNIYRRQERDEGSKPDNTSDTNM